MAKNIRNIIQEMPAKRQKTISKRAKTLIAQELCLRDLREKQALTQEELADILKIGQDGISKLENRKDIKLSTLRNYIKAIGGKLKIVATFKDEEINISGLLSRE